MNILLLNTEKDLLLKLIKGQQLVPAEKRELIDLEMILEADQEARKE
jgi:hypothetical protein